MFCLLSAEVTRILRAMGINVLLAYVDEIIFEVAPGAHSGTAMAIISAILKASWRTRRRASPAWCNPRWG